jgi:outer membrane lipoprotein-sorting protein
MKFNRVRMATGVVAALALSLMSGACANQPEDAAQTPSAQPAQTPAPPTDGVLMADQVFTNVQELKGVPVDQFLDTMGMFTGALLFDCVSCHDQQIEGGDQKAFAITTPEIQKARGMIRMMNEINQKFFGGEQQVTCFTCHHGDDRPDKVPNLVLQYGELEEDPYEVEFIPSVGAPPAAEIFDKYFKALGGADQIAKFTSYVATGTYSGYDTELQEVPVEITGKAPNQRSIVAQAEQGQSLWVFDGTKGWRVDPAAAVPLIEMTGGNLAGEKIEATLMFPSSIPQAYDEWQVAYTDLDGRQAIVLYGIKEGEQPLTLYFDTTTGLLVRSIRWNPTLVGNVPKQVDYSNYRRVAGIGIQIPFTWKITWTGGETNIQLKDIKANVEVDPAKFAKPPAPKPYSETAAPGA